VLPGKEPVGKLLGDGFVFNQVIQYCMAQRFCQQ